MNKIELEKEAREIVKLLPLPNDEKVREVQFNFLVNILTRITYQSFWEGYDQGIDPATYQMASSKHSFKKGYREGLRRAAEIAKERAREMNKLHSDSDNKLKIRVFDLQAERVFEAREIEKLIRTEAEASDEH